MDPIQSRRAIRKDVTLKGNFKIKDALKCKLHIYKEPIDLTVTDVAALGCGFVTAYYLPKGLILIMNIKDFPITPLGATQKTKDMEFSGKVMMCRTTPSRANRIGIAFTDIQKEDLEIIRKFIGSKD